MANHKPDGGSFLGHPQALFAILTIAAGLWLVSQKLTSNRPVIPAGAATETIGDQKLEARLWEDPFKELPQDDQQRSNELSGLADVNTLPRQIARRMLSAGEANRVLLLPVMISGGQYSEDRESRIRSRFAIVSALGEAGFVPEDAEHIGALRLPWLTEQEMFDAKRNGEPMPRARLWREERTPDRPPDVWLLNGKIGQRPGTVELRYEWYRARVFAPGFAREKRFKRVLVLWLDEARFEDEPLLRLPLLLEPLTDVDRFRALTPPGTMDREDALPAIALIGPRRSSTLRSMLPEWQTGASPWREFANPALPEAARAVLRRIDLFAATPSATEEVLVKLSRRPLQPGDLPRSRVGAALTSDDIGFKSFHNFTATDADMAGEILAELELRGADLARPTQHVVLISEWDTFYGRMLALTYRAELAQFRYGRRGEPGVMRAKFIDAYISPGSWQDWPVNFHSIVYLRGLDGQTVGGDRTADDAAGSSAGRKTRPHSIEEISLWKPDVNKAEGQAQFDYLGRIGDQIEQLRQKLRREDEGRIAAIGIVGSDVYDTLLLLQALRERFSNVRFFTTDLDVRFFHPREREWARNLVVVSSYGLALDPKLQGAVSPFRDSTQTAQFAAGLAALGNSFLMELPATPPRRFEVGNRTAVDLSVEPAAGLHPLTLREEHKAHQDLASQRVRWALLAAALFLAAATWVWRPLRRLTWDAWQHPAAALIYTEEDIGGPDAAESLLRRIGTVQANELAEEWKAEPVFAELAAELSEIDGKIQQVELRLQQAESEVAATGMVARDVRQEWERREVALRMEREGVLDRLTTLIVERLRRRVREKAAQPNASCLPVMMPWRRRWILAVMRYLPGGASMIAHYGARVSVDALLDRLSAVAVVKNEPVRPPVRSRWPRLVQQALGLLATVREEKDWWLDHLLGKQKEYAFAELEEPGTAAHSALEAAAGARMAAIALFHDRCRRLASCWLGFLVFAALGLQLAREIWQDTLFRPEGEPFSLVNGISAWPAEIVRLLVFILAVGMVVGLSHRLRETFLRLRREFRFYRLPRDAAENSSRGCARKMWFEYCDGSRFRQRCIPILSGLVIYIMLLRALRWASGEVSLKPLRGTVIAEVDFWMLWGGVCGFLLVAFLTMDAASLCRRFIENLSATHTQYPTATQRHFSRQRGNIPARYLDEWIDVQLIARLTEEIGRLVYYPAGLLLLLLLARNSWWDNWSWPFSMMLIFAANFVLALASVVILQRAAQRAKRAAEENLTAKARRGQAEAAQSVTENNAMQAEKLLGEIRELNRGAFASFWDNPVVGAIFLSSGGTTLLQVSIWLLAR